MNCTTCQRPIAADAARCEGCGAEVLAGSLVVGAQDTLLALGRRVGDRYEVLGTIGVGALGVTYRVRDHDLNSTVALKVIYRHLMFSETDERRLREWFEVVRHWGDERIAAPLRHGKSEAGYYVVAPFVEGPSLGRIESRRGPLAGPLEPHRVTALVRGLHRALDRMGDSVHGALHPSNILITPSFPVITDPAPYRAVMSGLWLEAVKRLPGAAEWLAPEVRNERFDLSAAADVYSVSVIAAWLMTGKLPGARQREALKALPPQVARVLQAGMVEAPSDRLDNLEPLLVTLEDYGAAQGAAIEQDAAQEVTALSEVTSLSIRDEDLLEVVDLNALVVRDAVEPQAAGPAAGDLLPTAPPTGVVESPLAVPGPRTPPTVVVESPLAVPGPRTPPIVVVESPFAGPGPRTPPEVSATGLEKGLRKVGQAAGQSKAGGRELPHWGAAGMILLFGIAVLAGGASFWATKKLAGPGAVQGTVVPNSSGVTGYRAADVGTVAERIDLSAKAPPPPAPSRPRVERDAGGVDVVSSPAAVDGGLPEASAAASIGLAAPGSTAPVILAESAPVLEPAALVVPARRPDSGAVASSAPAPVTPPVVAEPAPAAPAPAAALLPRPRTSRGKPKCPAGTALVRLRSGKVYCVDRYEYPNFVRSAPQGNFNAFKASALCAKKGRRMCTEREWEIACRGPGGKSYGYSNRFVAGTCNTAGEGNDGPVAPTRYKRCRSGFRTFAMSGNLAEWVKRGSGYALKGGSFERGADASRCAARMNRSPRLAQPEFGVRCCSDPTYE